MSGSDPRPGRPRRYDFAPLEGFFNRDAAYLVAALDELSERLFDLVTGLSPAALNSVPAGGTNSIGMLVRHMAYAEAFWVSAATMKPIRQRLAHQLAAGAQEGSGELPRSAADASELIEIARRVRREITRPRIAPLDDIDVEIEAGDRALTVRGTLMNQLWHWTYHTGQVGLLRRLAGEKYEWTYGKRIAGGPG